MLIAKVERVAITLIALLKALSPRPLLQRTFQALQCLIELAFLPLPNHPANVQCSDERTAVVVIPQFNIAMCLNPSGNVGIEAFKRASHGGTSQDHRLRRSWSRGRSVFPGRASDAPRTSLSQH